MNNLAYLYAKFIFEQSLCLTQLQAYKIVKKASANNFYANKMEKWREKIDRHGDIYIHFKIR